MLMHENYVCSLYFSPNSHLNTVLKEKSALIRVYSFDGFKDNLWSERSYLPTCIYFINIYHATSPL